MADVLIVCVREDEPQAKALAEMFEAAGFSVGGAPSSDGALRGSGAGLVVWSQASIRSRPFLDAAQRVINANKAVVASLIEPPPPSSIGDSPAFDLSGWTGDPNDPSLDPLFFAVDRMVNSARAEVAAPAEHYEAPAPRPAPPPPPYARRPPPSEPRPAPMPQGFEMRNTRGPSGDALGSEAEHWRAIRNSRNPADFMDYLARYGADGAFADVAELRLKQLTSASAPEARTPPRAPAPPQQARLEPAPQRRAEAPPPRRIDPPPPRRMETPPPRRPSFDRGYNETRDPPKGEGGALRAFVLIALLGGAALAGGLYFGGGLNGLTGGAATTQHEDAPPPAPSAPADASTVDQADSSGVSLSDAVNPTPALTSQQQRERDRQRQQQQDQQQQRASAPRQQANAEAAVPSPTTSWTDSGSTTPSGPVSLRSTEQSSNAPGQVVVPLSPPPISPTQLASNTTNAATPRTTPPGSVLWTQRPSSRRIAELYPPRALRSGSGGRVELDCTVRANLSADCSVATENPAELGFGRAALGAVASYRARETLSNGQPSAGARTRIAIQFQPPAE